MSGKRIAIVTGASSGLGKEFTGRMLQESVDEVWAIARNEKKLEKLKNTYGEMIRTFSVDLSSREAMKQWSIVLQEEQPVVCYLVNNAGYDKFGDYKDLSVDESLNMIDLNCAGVVAMGLFCIPFMKEGSIIINIASQASFQPLPYQNIYAATKAFVRNYSRALNVELKHTGIKVVAVCPGWVDTALFERANIGSEKTIQNFWGMVKPEQVVNQALRDAKRGKDISVCSMYVKFCHLVAKILPQRMMMKLWLWQQRM